MSSAVRRLRAVPAAPRSDHQDLTIWQAHQSLQQQTARQAYLIRKMIVDHQEEIGDKDREYDTLFDMFTKERKEHNKVKAFLEALCQGVSPL